MRKYAHWVGAAIRVAKYSSYRRTEDDRSMACRQSLVTFPFFRRTFLRVVVVIHLHKFNEVVVVDI